MITKPSRTEHRILIVEDDAQIARLVAAELRDAACAVDWACDGERGLEKFRAGSVDLVVLDLNLPGIDGLEVCQRIRATDRLIPILMLSARTTKQDIVRGLELGADEYLTKPFSTLELVARIRALFRRVSSYREQAEREEVPEPIRCGTLLIDAVKREANIAGQAVSLTAKEFDLLLLFAKHPGRTFTRAELLNRVWGDGFEGYEHTVNTHINRLRNKVERNAAEPKLIETVWGLGYRLASPSASP